MVGREPDFAGVVVAAGRSERFGGPLPKQFLELAGTPVLRLAVGCLAGRPGVGGIVVVLAPEERDGARGAAVRSWPGVTDVVSGGATRSESVALGLAATGEVPYVLVHDAARPLAAPELVDAVIEATRRHGAALPGLPIADTVKELDAEGWILRTPDRDRLVRAQTPQGARSDWLREALARVRQDGLEATDEAAALEHAGYRVAVVAGDPENVKITTARDFERARRRLDPPEGTGLRVGTGFDVHRFGAADRPLVLGGVLFPGEQGLLGHSDADVVLHAAMDALLGAAGLDDIGAHFPPEDPRWAGAASTALAARIARVLEGRGFEVVNLDLTVLAERPRIRENVPRMREAVARCFGIDPARVGLKATTLERLGALGREEGIACQAVGLIRARAADRGR